MRILTGIQSTNTPHLGNILGATMPALQLATQTQTPSLFFIADLHTLTTNPEPTQHKRFIQLNAAAWLACGLNTKKDILYKQSDLPQVCELTWYFSCLTPYTTLTKAHAFKEKSKHLHHVNVGLFNYPLLMAADILLYNPTHIPVGIDQLQHIEIARQIAKRFNHTYGPTFNLPKPYINKKIPTIQGTDGRKMSKSYHNTISPFSPEKTLYKNIMAIPTDSTPLATPKNPNNCNIFKLYSLLAHQEQTAELKHKYLAGGYGYDKAKKALYHLIIEKFAQQRATFNTYMQHPQELTNLLTAGKEQAQAIAHPTLQTVRKALSYSTSLA